MDNKNNCDKHYWYGANPCPYCTIEALTKRLNETEKTRDDYREGARVEASAADAARAELAKLREPVGDAELIIPLKFADLCERYLAQEEGVWVGEGAIGRVGAPYLVAFARALRAKTAALKEAENVMRFQTARGKKLCAMVDYAKKECRCLNWASIEANEPGVDATALKSRPAVPLDCEEAATKIHEIVGKSDGFIDDTARFLSSPPAPAPVDGPKDATEDRP